MDSIIDRLLRHRRLAITIWLIMGFLGLLLSPSLSKQLSTSLAVPNTGSATADAILAKHFSENIEGTFTVVYQFKSARASEITEFQNRIAKAAEVIPQASIGQSKAIAGYLVENIDTPLSLNKASHYVTKLRSALRNQGMASAMVTGPAAIQSDVTPILNSDLRRGEIIGVFIALLLLLLALGISLQVLIPIIFGFATVGLTLDLLYLVANKFLIVLYAPNIVTLVGLGLAIDYSLLMIFKFRREIQSAEGDREAAIRSTLASAGRTVRVSGLTVALSMVTMMLIPIPFIRSIAFAVALMPLVAVLAAFTLQPALLSYLPDSRAPRTMWKRLSRVGEMSIRRPKTISALVMAVLIFLGWSVLSLHLTPSSLTAIPPQLESERAISLVTGAIGPGVTTPNELVIDLGGANSAQSPSHLSDVNNLANYLAKDPEISIVAKGTKPPYIDSTGRFVRIFVVGRHSFGDPHAAALVKKLRALQITQFGFAAGTVTYVAGAAAQGSDLLHVLARTLPWLAILAMFLTFVLLARAFNSLLLPAKAILLDVFSLGTTLGIVVFIFRSERITHWLGLYHLTSIEAWAVTLLVMLLYGISMDYEVFLIAGIAEARRNTVNNREAISVGMRNNALIVMAAALIFVGTVAGLAFSHFAGLQEIGIGLAFGALIDATLVRGLLLPALMALFGRWNWWLPKAFARLIGTSPAPLDEVRG